MAYVTLLPNGIECSCGYDELDRDVLFDSEVQRRAAFHLSGTNCFEPARKKNCYPNDCAAYQRVRRGRSNCVARSFGYRAYRVLGARAEGLCVA